MAILNLAVLDKTPLEHDPYEFVVARDVLRPESLPAVNKDYPQIDKPANFAPEDLEFGPSFQALLDEVNSPEFDEAVSRKFGVNLDGAIKTITVRKYSEPSDGNIHTDHWSKIITGLFYFNPEWTQEGGKLRILRSAHDIEDFAAEVPPLGGTFLAFRRSRKSYHGYKIFDGERRMMQINWVMPNRFAWRAQQLARLSTHTAKRISRWWNRKQG